MPRTPRTNLQRRSLAVGALRLAKVARVAGLILLVGASGCARDTSKLTPAWEQRFATEGIIRRADNAIVRHTREDGRYESTYRDSRASVIVTRQTILIHEAERVLLEVTPRTRRDITISRREGRVRIRAAGERVVNIFSFEPAEDATGWATDLRTVAKGEGDRGAAPDSE